MFFSSHLLEEMEHMDCIAMLHHGKIVLCGALDDIKAQHRRITLRFLSLSSINHPVSTGALAVTGAGREWTVIGDCSGTASRAPASSRKSRPR